MSKVRVLYKPDKSVVVIHPAPKSRRPDETEEQWLKRVLDKATPSGASYDDIDSSELPQSREDRGAWEGEKGKKVKVNQVKAKQIKDDKKKEQKIQARMRKLAEDDLKEKGEL